VGSTPPGGLTNLVITRVKENSPSTNYNSDLKIGTRTDPGNNMDAVGYVYWVTPFPAGASIISATLTYFTTPMAENVAHNFKWTRLNQTFDASKMTYPTRPLSFISGDKNISKTGVLADKTRWDLDITDWMQTVASGGKWYGLKVIASEAILRYFYSELYSDTTLRPFVTITWSDKPRAPGSLSPAGGRAVGVSKPTVKAQFLDVSGSVQLASVQVQIDAANDFTSGIDYDSGTVSSTVPELDLSRTDLPGGVWAGLSDGATTYWRIRFQDGAGLWSDWSASTSFKRDDKGVLTMTNPPALPQPNGGFYRATFTTGNSSGTAGMYYRGGTGGDPGGTTVPGEVLIISAWFRTSQARSIDIGIEIKDSAGNILTGSGTTYVLAANTWTKITHVAPANPANSAMFTFTGYSATGVFTTGSTLDFTAISVSSGANPANRLTAAYGTNVSYVGGLAGTGGAMSFSNPSTGGPSISPAIEDATPPFAWTFSGETQAAYQVQVKHTENGVEKIDWDTGKITGTLTSITPPAGKITLPNVVYTVTLKIWDTKDRETVPGSPAYQEVVRTFTFVPGVATGTTGLTATPDAGGKPKVVLQWTSATMPDRFNVLRNGKIIAGSLDPTLTLVSGTTHSYTDRTASPRRTLVYEVQRVVNNVASASNSTDTKTLTSRGRWLQEPITGLELFIANKEDVDMTLNATESVLQGIAPDSVPVAINQSLGGLEGTLSGLLVSTPDGVTAQQWRDIYIQLRNMRVKSFYLTMDDYTMQVVCQEFTYARKIKSPKLAYQISFKFYQQDSISSILLGS
jgi:hypothetical protein